MHRFIDRLEDYLDAVSYQLMMPQLQLVRACWFLEHRRSTCLNCFGFHSKRNGEECNLIDVKVTKLPQLKKDYIKSC